MSANPHKGFIALMSAVIISAVLLLIVVSGSLTGFFARSNVFDAELKNRSRAVADACLDQALLLITNNADYADSEYQAFNELDACELAVTGSPSAKDIEIQGSSTKAVTNLAATYNAVTRTFTSLQEVP